MLAAASPVSSAADVLGARNVNIKLNSSNVALRFASLIMCNCGRCQIIHEYSGTSLCTLESQNFALLLTSGRRNGQEDGLIKQVFDYTLKWSVSWEGWWMAGEKVS